MSKQDPDNHKLYRINERVFLDGSFSYNNDYFISLSSGKIILNGGSISGGLIEVEESYHDSFIEGGSLKNLTIRVIGIGDNTSSPSQYSLIKGANLENVTITFPSPTTIFGGTELGSRIDRFIFVDDSTSLRVTINVNFWEGSNKDNLEYVFFGNSSTISPPSRPSVKDCYVSIINDDQSSVKNINIIGVERRVNVENFKLYNPVNIMQEDSTVTISGIKDCQVVSKCYIDIRISPSHPTDKPYVSATAYEDSSYGTLNRARLEGLDESYITSGTMTKWSADSNDV